MNCGRHSTAAASTISYAAAAAWTPPSAPRARTSPAASASASPWHAPCCTTRLSTSSTRQPPTSTQTARPRSSTPWPSLRTPRPSSWCRTAWLPCAAATRCTSSRPAASCKRGPTWSLQARTAPTHAFGRVRQSLRTSRLAAAKVQARRSAGKHARRARMRVRQPASKYAVRPRAVTQMPTRRHAVPLGALRASPRASRRARLSAIHPHNRQPQAWVPQPPSAAKFASCSSS